MKKRTKELLRTIYDYDAEKHSFIVRVLIQNYRHLFNELDPAPLKQRDLNQEILNYLDECSLDIPLKYGVRLEFIAEHDFAHQDNEQRARTGLKTYFTFVLLTLHREIVSTYRKCAVYIFASFLLLFLSFYLNSQMANGGILFSTLLEGLSIGGWVFLWEAIALVVFSNRETRASYRRNERLRDADVSFVYPDSLK